MAPIKSGVAGEARSWLVRPATPITWQATRVHGLTIDAVRDPPAIDEVRTELVDRLADHVIVGHNVLINVDVLTRELSGWRPVGTLDTLRLPETCPA